MNRKPGAAVAGMTLVLLTAVGVALALCSNRVINFLELVAYGTL